MLLIYNSLRLSLHHEAAGYQAPIPFSGNFKLHLSSVPVTTRLQALLGLETAAKLLPGQWDQQKTSAALVQSSKTASLCLVWVLQVYFVW